MYAIQLYCSLQVNPVDWLICMTLESTNILTKKKIFDAYMSKMRLQEEKILILREMRQHCTYLRGLADGIRKLIAEMSGGNRGKNMGLTLKCRFYYLFITYSYYLSIYLST